MAFLRSKWAILTGCCLLVLLILSITSRTSAHAEIIIETSPQQVWDILMDEEAYPTWNDVLIPVTGLIEEGNELNYRLLPPSGEPIEITMTVNALIPLELLNQRGGIPGIFTYDHHYMLKEVEGKTRVIIHEDFKGIGLFFIDLDWVQPAYARLNQSLRRRSLERSKEPKSPNSSK